MNDDLTPKPPRLPDEEIQRRHDQIRRGLARSNMVTAVAFFISIGLALVAVFYALQAHHHARSA
ncbi:MAG TPA: hypothetical protein VI136_06440, partial [Verrucomicrobiae bacterium]